MSLQISAPAADRLASLQGAGPSSVERRLAFGLLDTSLQLRHPMLAEKLRSFTISWSRYGYHGPIYEGTSIQAVLAQAAAHHYGHCLIQKYGHVIVEPWAPDNWDGKDFHQSLSDLIDGQDFLVALPNGSEADQSDPPCLLVNVQRWDEAGRPPLELSGDPFVSRFGSATFPTQMADRTLFLGPDATQDASQFAACLGDAIAHVQLDHSSADLSADQRKFLGIAYTHTSGAQRGVFLWNVESYSDVAAPAPDAPGPVGTLACVAAGFKPNIILQTRGLDADTRVVFFDYSAQALAFRKLLHEEWDGDDYPSFLTYVFRKLPSPETFYHLWNDKRPEELRADDFRQAWENEIRRWGSAQAIKSHWRDYRRLRHDFVHCNILSEPNKLFERLGTGPHDVIWWSNAFFTVFSNWFLTVPERKRIYDNWVRGLADRNRQMLLYGFDYNNTSVNNVRAGEYTEGYFRYAGDYLNPQQPRLQIRC